MHKNEFDRLEGQLPKTAYPFKSTVTCGLYRKEEAQARGNAYREILGGQLGR
jgi:hypothetical protein